MLAEADPIKVPPNFSTIKPRVNAIQFKPVAGVAGITKFAKLAKFAMVYLFKFLSLRFLMFLRFLRFLRFLGLKASSKAWHKLICLCTEDAAQARSVKVTLCLSQR